MPIARYFVVVGAALAAVLLIAGWFLPESPASFRERPESVERAAIRIRSAWKWPEKIVMETNQPTMPSLSVEAAPTEQSDERLPDEVTDQTIVDVLPKRKPDARMIEAPRSPARAKRRTATAFRSPHEARIRHRKELPTLGRHEACCWFEWADRSVMSKPASRKRVAR